MCPLTRPKAPPIGHVVSLLRGAGIPIASGRPIQIRPVQSTSPSLEENRVQGESQPTPRQVAPSPLAPPQA